MKTKDMIYVALFAGIVAALGIMPPIPLPFGVPITLQSFGVMLAGAILGARLGAYSLLIFVLLVAVGSPVLSGGRGGIGFLFGPTGGYILSWPLAAFIIGFLIERFWNSLSVTKVFIINIVGGILVVYAIGLSYFIFITDVDFTTALLGNMLFIPGDLLKAYLAAWIAIKIKKSYPLIHR
ncbi:MAG: biotin transporter BioY [Vulcanibacillus sp.]